MSANPQAEASFDLFDRPMGSILQAAQEAEGAARGDRGGREHAAHHGADDPDGGDVAAGEVEAGDRRARAQVRIGEPLGRGLDAVDRSAGGADEVVGGQRGRELDVVDQRGEGRHLLGELGEQAVLQELL